MGADLTAVVFVLDLIREPKDFSPTHTVGQTHRLSAGGSLVASYVCLDGIFLYRGPPNPDLPLGEEMVFIRIRDRESIQEAVRRFRKIVERSGLKREMRRRQYYEKPSTIKRRARLRAERRAFNDRNAQKVR